MDMTYLPPLDHVKAAKHSSDIKNLLTETFCMDSKGQIRAWKHDTWSKLNNLGHNSLDVRKCKCQYENQTNQG